MYHFNPKIDEFLTGLEKEGAVITKKTDNDFSVKMGSKSFMVNTSDYNKTRKINYDIPDKKKGGFVRISLRIIQIAIILKILFVLYNKLVNGSVVPEDKKAREEYHKRQSGSLSLTNILGSLGNTFF